jgi:hypothetical protein
LNLIARLSQSKNMRAAKRYRRRAKDRNADASLWSARQAGWIDRVEQHAARQELQSRMVPSTDARNSFHTVEI